MGMRRIKSWQEIDGSGVSARGTVKEELIGPVDEFARAEETARRIERMGKAAWEFYRDRTGNSTLAWEELHITSRHLWSDLADAAVGEYLA